MSAAVLNYALFALFPLALVYAALSDLVTMTIPNRLVLAIVALFLLLAPMTGMGWADFGWHLAAGAIVLVLGFTLFALGWIGGGDAKFAAAVALFLGVENALPFVAYASILGGAETMLLLGFRQVPVPAAIIRQPWVARLHLATTGVPYGIALAGAGALVYRSSVWTTLIAG